jgi:hypothetical protein
MNKITGMIALMTVSVLLALAARAEPAAAIPDAFMKQLVEGINARDLSSLRRITHPETLRCMTTATNDYYAWWLWKNGSKRYTIASDYKAALAPPLDTRALESAVPPEKATLHWPVQPDNTLRITYSPAAKSTLQRAFEITLKDGNAELVMDCPTPAGLEIFRKMAQEDALRQKKLDRLWKSMDDTDKQAFVLMATQGMKLEVMNVAEQKFGLNSDESLAFMDMVQYADMP